MIKQLTTFEIFRDPFYEQMQKLKREFGLHIRVQVAYEPIPKSAQCDPKITEKTNTCNKHYVLLQIRDKSRKLSQTGAQMGEGMLVVLGTFGAPICFLIRKVHPKCSQSDPKVPKS